MIPVYFIFIGSNMDELRQELVKAELKIDQLVLELQSKERDLFNEKSELEKVGFDYFDVCIEEGNVKFQILIGL